jgi:hypothetical protein
MSYSAASFYNNITLGRYSNIVPWSKIGYSPTVNTTESDVWSKAGLYGNSGLFPATAVQMEIVGSENTNDIGTIIKGSRTTPVTSDAGGSTTTLYDADGAFTSATAVAAGDCLILDPSGTTPEWGYVTSVTADTLTCEGGFSSGGVGTTRKYLVIDYSAHTGAQVLKVDYLDSTYAQKTIILPTNGTTAVTTLNDAGTALSDLFRIQSFRMIAAGSGKKCSGNWQIQTVSGGTVWSYITLGFTRARNTVYTVPANKTLYIVQWNVGWSSPNDTKVQTARFYTRANVEPATMFNTGNVFFPYTEVCISNQQTEITFPITTKLPQKSDMKVSALALTGGSGPATSVLRGFLVS